MPPTNTQALIDICVDHCDHPDFDCARFDELPRDFCAFARAARARPVVTRVPDIGNGTIGVTEAARRLGISPDGVRRRIKRGQLPASGGRYPREGYRIPVEALNVTG